MARLSCCLRNACCSCFSTSPCMFQESIAVLPRKSQNTNCRSWSSGSAQLVSGKQREQTGSKACPFAIAVPRRLLPFDMVLVLVLMLRSSEATADATTLPQNRQCCAALTRQGLSKQTAFVYVFEMCGVLLHACGTLLPCQVPEEPTYFQRSATSASARSQCCLQTPCQAARPSRHRR